MQNSASVPLLQYEKFGLINRPYVELQFHKYKKLYIYCSEKVVNNLV